MIYFIVPVVNKPSLVTKFLTDLTSHCSRYGEGYQVLFVDNGSDEPTQRTLEMLDKRYECVGWIRNEQNIGFGPANNRGVEVLERNCALPKDIFVFTQPDVTFHGDPLPLIGEAKYGELYGARLLSHDTGWNTFSPSSAERIGVGTVTVPYLEGWFLSCTKETWDRLGGFDPRYVPADFEDVDLCYHAVRETISLVEKPFPVAHNHPGSSAWQQFQERGTDREAVTRAHRELFKAKWNL